MFAVNVKGAFFTMQYATPLLNMRHPERCLSSRKVLYNKFMCGECRDSEYVLIENEEKVMFDINHQVGIKASPEKIYEALTTNEGLSEWWTNDTSGAGDVGSIIEFRFNGGGPDFTVTALIPNETVKWTHSGSIPEAWVGTVITFNLRVDNEQTFVRFTHSNWQESSDFMAHCNTKWAVFLLSLKSSLETNLGQPFPNDIQIDHS